ncbi:MAG: VWA domain-containing protein [Myxococcales bacterium]|nr:VWA domain-containing protein [Myxococcales bacterium]
MSSLNWAHLELVHLMWPAAALVIFLAYGELAHRNHLGRFVSATMQKRLAVSISRERRVVRLFFVFATMAFCTVALMRPQTQGVSTKISTSRVAADIVVALDVSKSMLAEDAAPNRLARAKSEISRMLDQLAGHRVSLVVFAGRASILSPLTPDYGFFRMMLRGASPTSVSRGGTAIGEAIRTGLDAFDEDGGAASRLLLLITDGEDHDSYPEEAAKLAKEAGVTIVAIGLGSEDGSNILITNPRTGVQEIVKDRDGNEVMTRVDGELLQAITSETGGVYIPAKVAALDLQEIVDEHIEPIVQEASLKASRSVPGERYPLMLLLALLSLITSVLLGTSPSSSDARRATP